MRPVLLIVQKELGAYFKSMLGYLVFAVLLFVDGLLFHGLALGGGDKLSATVLTQFFNFTSGVTMIAAILLSMRLFAEEQRDGTLVLLYTAPLSDWQIILGKWLSAWTYLTVFLALTAYMPLLVMVNGTVSGGQLLSGYLGLWLLGAAVTAIGTFASSLTRSQLLAGAVSGAIVTTLVLAWQLSSRVDPPFDVLFSFLALHNKHFLPFMQGSIHVRDIVYYVSVTFLYLLLTRQVLAARRWT